MGSHGTSPLRGAASQSAQHVAANCATCPQPVGLPDFSVGWAQSQGNRPYQDDRCVEFTLPLPDGSTALVWAVSRPAAAAAAAASAATMLCFGVCP